MAEIFLIPLNLGTKTEFLLEVTYQQIHQSANKKELSLISADFCNNHRQERVMTEERITKNALSGLLRERIPVSRCLISF